jgi:hypothetical protein
VTRAIPMTPTQTQIKREHIDWRFGAGPECVVHELKKLVESPVGTTVTFLIADHPKAGGHIHRRQTVGLGLIDGVQVVRWCAPGDPISPGSSSVIMSGRADSLDPAHLAAIVVYNLTRTAAEHAHASIFRYSEGGG